MRGTRNCLDVVLFPNSSNTLLLIQLADVTHVTCAVAVAAETTERVDPVVVQAAPTVRTRVRQADVADEALHQQHIEVHLAALRCIHRRVVQCHRTRHVVCVQESLVVKTLAVLVCVHNDLRRALKCQP